MSSRHKSEPHYDNHQRAAELEAQATHMHRAAGNGQLDHETAHEQSRQAQEHSHSHRPDEKDGHLSAGQHGIVTFGHAEIAALAHQLWEERGRPEGSPEEDWHQAVVRLRSQNL